MGESIDQLRVSFVEETRDLINELEDTLLSIESDAVSSDVIDQIFRSIHTIKGSGGMLGFEKVLEVTHDLEDIYDKVRSNSIVFSVELREISLETIDMLKALLATDEKLSETDNVKFANLVRKIQLFVVGDSDAGEAVATFNISSPMAQGIMSTFLIQIIPGLNVSKDLTHPKYLINEVAQMGDCLAFAKSGDSIRVNSFDKVNKNASWIIILCTDVIQERIVDVFDWVKEDLGVTIKLLTEGDLLAIPEAKTEFSNLKNNIFEKSIEEIDKLANKYSEQLAEAKKKKEITEKVLKKSTSEKITNSGNSISSIRVATDKIDQLMNLVSEMVTLQARLNLIATELDNPELLDVSEKYGSFSKQLRDNAFTISLIPFGVSMTRYKRMVHDLAEQLGKKIDFVTEGSDTVLDKKIIEQLSDPIMHILRNSIDHGIEDQTERKKLGKNPVGQITMDVYHQSNNVIIKIEDDGHGIDSQVIRNVAIKKNLIKTDQNLSESELINLIFLPGFSSAKSVSNVSGRGVGLDVVKKNISRIRGTIEINTQKGKGTTFIIKLPLTLSIIDGLQVRVADRDLIIPLFQVDRIATITNELDDPGLNQFLVIDGMQVPYFDLREDFEIKGEIPKRREIVVTSYENEKVAVVVDYVVGENQTVLKPLGKHFKRQDFISGGTILGDGSVALVLDINKIVKVFSKK